VPPKAQLAILSRASMAQPIVPKEISEAPSMLGEDKPFGRPLFARLVPFAVHAAAEIYTERRDTLINSTIITSLENLTTNLHE
jgi:programmed cell death 6-interacting protein